MVKPSSRPVSSKHTIGGLMHMRGVLAEVASSLGRRIVAGAWTSGQVMPTEAELTVEMEVSRSVVREAIRVLNAKGLVRSRPMQGTTVMPKSEWRLLDPDIIHWQMEAGDRKALLADLLRLRLVVEPGAVRFATEAATAADRERIHAAWSRRVQTLSGGTQDPAELRNEFVRVDLAFHTAFLAAARSDLINQFVPAIEAAIELMVDREVRNRRANPSQVWIDEAGSMHADIYNAFCRQDVAGAEAATRALMLHTIANLEDAAG